MKNPDLAPVPEVPPESLLDSLDDANRDLQELAPDFWSVGLASAASKAAFLIQRRPAPFHPMFEEPLQTFLTEMLRRAEASHQANRPGVLTKAGPTGPVPDLEEGWLGHLFLCHVLLTRKAPEDRWRRQLDRFQKALARKKPPLGHEGIAARTLGELVQRFGLTELRGESARMLDEVWSAALRNGEDHTLEERLRLLQGYLIFP
jgi:hypothetical protein